MNDPAIATAADYADAMYTARRFKSVLVLLVLVVLLLQLGLFFVARYTDFVILSSDDNKAKRLADLFHYLVGASSFLGVIFTILLSFVMLLIVNIMLVGRLIGVARITSSYVWCLVLLVLLFPWQAFLTNSKFWDPDFNSVQSLKIPGVLYTWGELIYYAKFEGKLSPESILRWARFVGFPVIAIMIVLRIQMKSNRGLRQAFGEVEPQSSL